MSKTLPVLLLAFWVMGCQKSADSKATQSTKPNIVFILADDCTNWDLGAYGSPDAITPNIDRLAAEGMKFTRCYQAAPMCSPTRHNIFTGLYPVKTGAYPNHTFAKEGTKSIVQYLKPLGYRVALSGKRHIKPETIFDFEYLGKDKNPQFDLVEEFFQDAKSKHEPFALMLTSNEPHNPWNMGDPSLFNPDSITLPPFFPDTRVIREEYVKYLAEINFLDGQVGTTLELLEKYGLTENTLVMFASEQGAIWPFAKWTGYEAGVKSALIVKMPGMIEPGSAFDGIMEYTDIIPTFIELAGGNVPSILDGKSMVPILTGKQQSGKEYAFSLQTTRGINDGSDYYGIRTVVNNQYRYIVNLTPEVEFFNTINNDPKDPMPWFISWTEAAKQDKEAAKWLTRFRQRPAEELYDINKDPWCLNNLAGDLANKEIMTKLKKELENWMVSCGDEGQPTEMAALEHMWKNQKGE
ncbi:MAG: sulfatase [Cyclobacteriaceae bacterium]|nr:sulfatase [Cyclobacteriaceae bacterium SS2]